MNAQIACIRTERSLLNIRDISRDIERELNVE